MGKKMITKIFEMIFDPCANSKDRVGMKNLIRLVGVDLRWPNNSGSLLFFDFRVWV